MSKMFINYWIAQKVLSIVSENVHANLISTAKTKHLAVEDVEIASRRLSPDSIFNGS